MVVIETTLTKRYGDIVALAYTTDGSTHATTGVPASDGAETEVRP